MPRGGVRDYASPNSDAAAFGLPPSRKKTAAVDESLVDGRGILEGARY